MLVGVAAAGAAGVAGGEAPREPEGAGAGGGGGGGGGNTGTFAPEGAGPKTKLVIKPEVIDKHLGTADAILVHHGHYDHMADVPYVAKKTQATVLCTETHANLLRAMKTPDELLS